MKRLSMILAGALVIAADAFVLIGVGSNRSVTTQELELTERELALQPAGEENSGVSLRLQWISPERFAPEQGPSWLDHSKLSELGFDVGMPVTGAAAEIRYRDVPPREAFVVLEFGGANWEEWVKKQEAAAERMGQQVLPGSSGRSGTRLIAIDAGLDSAMLRRKYPDPAKHLVVHCAVRLSVERKWNPNTRRLMAPTSLRGWIDRITPDEIYVPLPQALVLSRLRAISQPRYAVTLRYGTRYEPWVVKVRPM